MISDISLQTLKLKIHYPRIAIIGATCPTQDYNPDDGINLGFFLRSYLKERNGVLFTGGVHGVGVDVYTGISRFLLKNQGKTQDDRFFLLVPDFIEEYSKTRLIRVRYEIPSAYTALARLFGNTVCVVRSGDNMDERRKSLADLADIVIVLNGGGGTLEEAMFALKQSKKVITFPKTGGIAKVLADKKSFGEFNSDIIHIAAKPDDMQGILDSLY